MCSAIQLSASDKVPTSLREQENDDVSLWMKERLDRVTVDLAGMHM